MASGLQIGEGQSWLTRNWIFEQLLTDVMAYYPDDEEVREVLDAVGILGYLVVDNYDNGLGPRLARMIYCVAKGILEGSVPSGASAALGVSKQLLTAYQSGIQDLVRLIEADGRYAVVLHHDG